MEENEEKEGGGWRDGPVAASTALAPMAEGSSDDDDDGGDDDDDDGGDDARFGVPATENDPDVIAVYKARAREPGAYSTHHALVEILRRKPDRAEGLRAAREAFSRAFPLPPQLWRQWICDEAKDLGDGDDEASRLFVGELCERALEDYADVPIWTTYLELMTGISPLADTEESDGEYSDNDSDDEETIGDDDGHAVSRALFQRAIVAAGGNYSLGQRLWRMFRNFERNICFRAKRDKASPSDISTCAGRVLKTYRDQLTMPLKGNERALESMRDFISTVGLEQLEGEAADVVSIHERALKQRLQCEAHEVAIATTASALAAYQALSSSEAEARRKDHEDAWLAYIESLRESGSISLVLCNFERAVATCRHTGSALWLKYCSFTSQQLRDATLTLRVTKRAIRNCPWEVDLHLMHLRALERTGSGPDMLDHAKEAALRAPLSGGPGAYRDVLLAYCDFCRRELTDAWSRSNPDVNKCVQFVQLLRGGFIYGLAFLKQTYPEWLSGRVPLYAYYANIEENLMDDIHGAEDAGVMIARRVWEECVETVGRIEASPWISFAQFECRQQAVVAERAILRRGFQTVPSDNPKWHELCDAWLNMERERGSLDDWEFALLRISTARLERTRRTAGREEDDTGSAAGGVDTFKARTVKTTDGVSSAASKKRPRIALDEEPGASLVHDAGKSDAQPTASKVKWPNHPLTVYVKGFPSDKSEEFLEETFLSCGAVSAVRILRDKRTKLPRGEGLVQFESASAVKGALALSTGTLVVVPSRFPASNADAPASKKAKGKPEPTRPTNQNPYLNAAAARPAEVATATKSGKPQSKPKPKFSFLPRSIKKKN